MVKIADLAEITNAEFNGDLSLEIESIAAKPEESSPSQIAFIFDNKAPKVRKKIERCKASAIFLSKAIKDNEKVLEGVSAQILYVDRPRYAMKQVVDLFAPKREHISSGIHPSAVIDETAELDGSVVVGPFVYIGPRSKIGANTKILSRVSIGADVVVGADCLFHSGVVIEDYSELGDRVIVQANSVIGSDGYSYVTKEPSNLEKLRAGDFNLNFDRQVQEKITAAGNVIIDDDVEIGSNTSIDRGTIGPTRIGKGTKIDNLVQIAHNVQVGKDCLIIANVGIAGSAKIGDRVTMAGGSGCGDGVQLGNDVVVAAYSPVNSDVDQLRPVIGYPAVDYAEFMKRQKAYIRLPRMQEDLRELKSKMKRLENHKAAAKMDS